MRKFRKASKWFKKSDLLIILFTGVLGFIAIRVIESQLMIELNLYGELLVVFIVMVFLYGAYSMFRRVVEEFSAKNDTNRRN